MRATRPISFLAALIAIACTLQATGENTTRLWADPPPVDPRLLNVRTLYQGSGFRPYSDKERWQARAKDLREQVLVAAGLWPLPEKCAMNPVIHGKIEREDYTIEKVFFQSYPGFYVTGNLYRPKGKTGPFPGVLCPHGHWENGRLYQASDKTVEQQLKGGFEKDADAARYPLQARAANLAKLGCVVFFYDMVGYADSDPAHFPHHNTFLDANSDLLLLSMFGLQTWDSIRAMDFLLSLPDVDPQRTACTGASGGGTQTFIMMTVDDRLKVAAPVCMISAGDHQGGCVCENNSLLRLFTDNVEFAATFAPKPFVHPTATGDWTHEFMEKGLPEIKATYKLFDAEQNVHAERFKTEHNYNLNSREMVYNWFNTHLRLGHAAPVKEQKFIPVTPAELAMFDDAHPRPANSVDAPVLKKYLVESAAAQLEASRPKDQQSLANYQQTINAALRHMLGTSLPQSDEVEAEKISMSEHKGFRIEKLVLSRKGAGERVPAVFFVPDGAKGPATLIIHPDGKTALMKDGGEPGDLVAGLLAKGQSVLAVDIFLCGELQPVKLPAVPKIEFFTGYNRTTLANRAHDILTSVGYLKGRGGVTQVNLVGVGKAGPWCLMARSLAGEAIARAAINADGFDFSSVKGAEDENYVPGALRYGGLWPLAAAGAPSETLIYNASKAETMSWMDGAFKAAGKKDNLFIQSAVDTAGVVGWITK